MKPTTINVSKPASVSEDFKTSPLPPMHDIPLDFNNIPIQLPDSHSWTLTDDRCQKEPMDQSVPMIIDLTKPNVLDLIRHACEKWGVFQVINHDIPISLFHEMECQSRRFFTLPTEQKLRVIRSPQGVTGYGLAHNARFFDKPIWSESFYIMGSSKEHASQLWPEYHEKFCEVTDQYQEGMKKFCEKLMKMILGSLGIHEEDLKLANKNDECDKSPCVLGLNSYPVCPYPNQTLGLGPHTDSLLFAVLYQLGNIGGLEVYKDDVGWLQVKPVEGALVVNIGDLMSIITNGKFKPVLHRAVVNKTHHRMSAVYGYGPPKNAKLSPLSKLVDHDHPPIYGSVTRAEYTRIKYSKRYDRPLDAIRI